MTRGDWLDGWEVEKSKSTTPAPGVLCKARLEMNKMNECGLSSHYARYVCYAVHDPAPNHLAIPEPVPESPCGVAWLAEPLQLLLVVLRGPLGGVSIAGKKHSR